jgi:hypothetical protein
MTLDFVLVYNQPVAFGVFASVLSSIADVSQICHKDTHLIKGDVAKHDLGTCQAHDNEEYEDRNTTLSHAHVLLEEFRDPSNVHTRAV